MLLSLSADEARDLVFSQAAAPKTETVSVADALTRVVSCDITAKMPYPPFDRSPYDGYAFMGEDTAGATRENPAVLKITEEIPAGKQPKIKITSGFAAKILTGAPIPEGANATVKYELTEFTETHVRIFDKIPPDTDVVRRGEDIKAGARIVSEGSVITPPAVSLLANQGFSSVEVYKKPVITVLSTGSELCEVGEPLRPAAIYNSNNYMLSAYLSEAGAAPLNRGSVPDNPELISKAVETALDSSDMVITTGGASVGDYDWAVRVAESIGADVLFWKVSMKPGGSMMAAVKNGKVILGLSGNPAAAVIGMIRVAMPYIKKLCGRADCFYERINIPLREEYGKGSPKTRLLRGRLQIADGTAYFVGTGNQGSADLSSFSGCDLLGEIPERSPPLPAGTLIAAYRL